MNLSKGQSAFHRSAIIRFAGRIIDGFSAVIRSSAFYGFIKNNCDFQASFKKSFLYSLFSRLNVLFPALLRLRLSFAKKCETGIFTGLLENTCANFLSLPLRTLGIYLLTFGTVVLVYSFKELEQFRLHDGRCIFAFICIFAAVIILPVKKSISKCIKSSRFLGIFHSEYSEIAPGGTNADARIQVRGFSTAFFTGLLCGIVSYLSTPGTILAVSAMAVLSLLFLNNPESSLLVTVLVLPFMSTAYVLYLVLLTFISFMFKYFRAKRHIKFELSDALIAMFAALLAFSGLFTASVSPSFQTSLKYIGALALFLLVKNIIRSTRLANRCITVIISSSVIISLLNLIYFFTADTHYGAYFSILTDAKPGTASIFVSPSALGIYICAVLPVVFSRLCGTGKPKYLIITLIHMLCLCACGIPAALYAAVFSLILVLALYNRVWIFALPFFHMISGLLSKLIMLSPFELSSVKDAGTQTVSVIKSALIMFEHHPLFGIGVGQAPFSELFPYYALPGSENVPYVNSLFIQLFICLGITGALYCAVLLFQITGKNLSYIMSAEPKDADVLASCKGVYGSCAAFLIAGIWTYPLGDTRLLLYFWLICALGSSLVSSTRSDYIAPHSVRDYQQSCGTY